MKKAAAVAVMILLASSVYAGAANTVVCDQASLSKLETEVGALSGREGKQAMKKLDKAKQAFKDGNTKKCGRLMEKVRAGKKKSPPSEQGPDTDEGDNG